MAEPAPHSAEHHHRIDYIEFAATDAAAARRFYSQVFGWSFQDYGPAYTSFSDGRIDGGFDQDAAVRPGGPLVVIFSTNLAATERSIVAAGGKIVRETFSFPGGRRFHFIDPSGNELAVWSDR
jgi:predicted enzyme related to lactoylglutathione lyase